MISFFFSSRRRHTRYWRDWSSDVCSSDLGVSVSMGCEPMAGGRPVDSPVSCVRAVTGASRWTTTGERPAPPRRAPGHTDVTRRSPLMTAFPSAPATATFDGATASTAYRAALEVIGAVEPRVADAIGQDRKSTRASLKLIASENYASQLGR